MNGKVGLCQFPNLFFSNDNQFCIIGFEFGNNGGYTELYKRSESEWKQMGIFNRFAY